MSIENPFLTGASSSKELQKKIETPRYDRVLSVEDQEHVENGLEAIWEDLKTASAETFPDLMVFVDSGARPLAAGVLPIARRVAKERGLPEPKNRFLAGTMQTRYTRGIEKGRESGDPEWQKKMIQKEVENQEATWIRMLEHETGLREKNAQFSEEYFEDMGLKKEDVLRGFDEEISKYRNEWETTEKRVTSDILKDTQELEANEKALSERLKEILEKAKSKHVFIVEDYLMHGQTLRQILRAFQSIEKKDRPEVTFMSFFAKQTVADKEYDRPSEERERELMAKDETRAWLDEGFQVLLPTQEWSGYTGFAFSHEPDIFGPMLTPEEAKKWTLKKGFIGVEKESGKAIVKRSEERDAKLMLQLRHEIRDIAKRVLKKHQKGSRAQR